MDSAWICRRWAPHFIRKHGVDPRFLRSPSEFRQTF